MKTLFNPPRPCVWKFDYVSWAVTTTYYCEELGETMCTVATFPTWREAVSYANGNSDTSQKA